MLPAAILDIDGTLVDSNYQHAIAWYRAFRLHGVTIPVWRCHRAIGMGGDQLVPHLAGDGLRGAEQGDDRARPRSTRCSQQIIHEVQPFAGARGLIEDLKSRGCKVVLASSAQARGHRPLPRPARRSRARRRLDGLQQRGAHEARAGPRRGRAELRRRRSRPS